MTSYYLDTSALIKRYINETGSPWLKNVLSDGSAPAIIIVHLAIVEMTSALSRRRRENRLTDNDYTQIQYAFRADCLSEYEIIIAAGNVVRQANSLLEKHSLRAYDAVHLASALVANQQLLAGNLESLIFLSADNRLNEAALAEGLAVENPNHHA